MKSRFCLAVLAFLLSGCMSDGTDTIVLLFPSSSSEEPSSSSEEPSSSSEEPSSSSEEPSSSSEAPSSSSEEPSSSSAVPSNCADFDPEAEVEHYGQMKKQICDERDGKEYAYVVIGEQTWMAENLNYDPGTGNSACYDNQTSNCDIYGRLYDWAAVMALPETCYTNDCSDQIQSPYQGICPDGWHISSKEEWEELVRYVDAQNGEEGYEDNSHISLTAGKYLKAKSRWDSNRNGTDDYGFSALPGGCGICGGNSGFAGAGSVILASGHWWGAYESSSRVSTRLQMSGGGNAPGWDSATKTVQRVTTSSDIYFSDIYFGFQMYSVRCVKDE